MRQVILLTKEDCRFCDDAKQVLARVGGEHELCVREVALESPEGRRLAAAAPFPPVVFLDGACFSYGRLSERKLRKALK
jgi:glutaredoxin